MLADNDVIVHGNPERPGDIDDRLGHVDVGARRRWIAGGMIMHQDDRSRGELECALDHLARIDRRVVDSAGPLHLVGDDGIALVEKENAELFLLGEALRGAAIVEHARP